MLFQSFSQLGDPYFQGVSAIPARNSFIIPYNLSASWLAVRARGAGIDQDYLNDPARRFYPRDVVNGRSLGFYGGLD